MKKKDYHLLQTKQEEGLYSDALRQSFPGILSGANCSEVISSDMECAEQLSILSLVTNHTFNSTTKKNTCKKYSSCGCLDV